MIRATAVSNDPGNQCPHLFNNIAGSLRWRRGADGRNKKAEKQLKQTRDILPESCRHFSTHWIRQDKGSPTGGPNARSSLEPFISLHHKAGSTGFCHADGCLFYRSLVPAAQQLAAKCKKE